MTSDRLIPRITACLVLLGNLLSSIAQAEGDAPYLVVLGIAQDAGYPQAGCYRPHCMAGWNDRDKRLGAASIALVFPQPGKAVLFDATPDFPEQLYQLELEQPGHTLAGVFLTHAHIGHYTGLMHLGREAMNARSVPVFAMPRMLDYLTNNGPWSQLVGLGNITLQALVDAEAIALPPAIRITPFTVPHRDEFSETVGYRIDGPNRSAVYIPDIDKWSRWKTDIRDIIRDVDYALLDATFYADGEIPGRAMSEIPHPFVTESMILFDDLEPALRSRVIFTHMNHTNPLLDEASKESAQVLSRGYRIAREGLRLGL